MTVAGTIMVVRAATGLCPARMVMCGFVHRKLRP
jgi:hypothetical protein